MKVFPGYQMDELTKSVYGILGMDLGKIKYHKFSDGEYLPQALESIRGKKVFFIMSTHSSDSIIADYLALKALRRSHAKIIPVITYFGYGRQDRRDRSGVPISSKEISDILNLTRPEEVVLLDPHNRVIEAFFEGSTILYGSFVLIPALKKCIDDFVKEHSVDRERIVQISPDDGRLEYNNFYAKHLGIARVLYCKKNTKDNNLKEVVFIDTRLPKDAVVVISDDLIDTMGTIEGGINAINALSRQLYGSDCTAFVISGTHGRFSGEANEKIARLPIFKIFVTDSIPVLQERCDKITTVSIAPVLAEAIRRIHNDESISEMFGMTWSDKLP